MPAFPRATMMQPAVIITGLLLGNGLDGIELCERLKADPRTREIPVILLTAWAHPDVASRAKRAGCVAVHFKPVAPTRS
jgi:CheY-like chemotaxis protein